MGMFDNKKKLLYYEEYYLLSIMFSYGSRPIL